MVRRWSLVAAVCSVVSFGCGRGQTDAAAGSEAGKPPKDIAEVGLEAQDHFGIKVATAEVERISEKLQVVGTVQPVTGRTAEIRPLARGRLLEVLVNVGDRVSAGQTLARMDNMEVTELLARLGAARAELERFRVQLAAAGRQAERSRRLTQIGAAPRREQEQSEAEEQVLRQSLLAQESTIQGIEGQLARFGVESKPASASSVTALAAPFAGVVLKLDTAPGSVVSPDMVLITVADLSSVWVQAEVYEQDLARVRVGQPADIAVETYPGQIFRGRVTHISDILDHQTRTARVRCEVANPANRLKLDMFATVRLPTTFARDGITVPAGAVQRLDGRQVVFVRLSATRFAARPVEPGRTVDGRLEIVSGLKPGDAVVTEGSFRLKSVLSSGELGEEE